MPTAYYKKNGEWKRLVSLTVLGGNVGTVETTEEQHDKPLAVDTKEEPTAANRN